MEHDKADRIIKCVEECELPTWNNVRKIWELYTGALFSSPFRPEPVRQISQMGWHSWTDKPLIYIVSWSAVWTLSPLSFF